MKSVILYKTGGIDSFKVEEVTIPAVKAEQILVRVEFAGVAFADVMMRHGKYPKMPKLPFTPGYDIFGIVEKTGANVSGIKAGDKVIALTQFGGYAEKAVVHYKRAIKVADDIEGSEAAALVLNYISAYQMLNKYKPLAPGNKILVHSAAGGVGTALVQIASSMGLKVYGTCSPNKQEVVKKCGGIPINYKEKNFVKVLKEIEPAGVDMVFDPIGGKNWLESGKVLNKAGMLIGFGLFSMFNKDKVIGSMLDAFKIIFRLVLKSLLGGNKFKFYNIQPDNFPEIQNALEKILDLYTSKSIKPVIYKIYSMDDVSSAHFDLANSKSYGKIILDCR